MTRDDQIHWDSRICENTLDAIAYSRTNSLIEKGMNKQAARHFAILETEKRQELARSVGADAALLAHLEWEDAAGQGFVCKLVLDDFPETAPDFFLIAFDLPSDNDAGR